MLGPGGRVCIPSRIDFIVTGVETNNRNFKYATAKYPKMQPRGR